jgi:hypothetical protein
MTIRAFKTGVSREQPSFLPPRIEDYVDPNNPVRAIEAFVNSLDLEKLGFRLPVSAGGAGQPPYHPADLLKLFMYGYSVPNPLLPGLGSRSLPQSRADLVAAGTEALFSDHRDVPQGQLDGAQGGEPGVRADDA